MDVPSETTAALDMLRAARAYVTSHGGTLHRQVLITGFSQGASAALGLGRALQDGADPWFRPGALAPISGAYDFGGAALPSVLDTAHCQAWFAAQGARVPAVNLGTPDYQGSRHYGSNVTGTAQIVRWFLRPADS